MERMDEDLGRLELVDMFIEFANDVPDELAWLPPMPIPFRSALESILLLRLNDGGSPDRPPVCTRKPCGDPPGLDGLDGSIPTIVDPRTRVRGGELTEMLGDVDVDTAAAMALVGVLEFCQKLQ
jgi:hypothetical protein